MNHSDELPKEEHERPMLSLDKTKDAEALKKFIGANRTLLSWKLDGLTIVLTYRDGELHKAVTKRKRCDRRGDHQQCKSISRTFRLRFRIRESWS